VTGFLNSYQSETSATLCSGLKLNNSDNSVESVSYTECSSDFSFNFSDGGNITYWLPFVRSSK
jgi:hypothetical protein